MDNDIEVAVEDYRADPKVRSFEFVDGHTLDVSPAIEASRQAKIIMAQKGTNDAFRKTMMRTAVIPVTP